MFRVSMQFSGRPVRKFTFDKSMVTIGRDATCDIVIDNIGASRRHALIERTGEGYVLADLKSHNGTYVRGEKVFHHRLEDADEFLIGKYSFQFEQLDPVVECGDGVDDDDPTDPDVPADMTFRMDRSDIEKLLKRSATTQQCQLVQLEPQRDRKTLSLGLPYYVIGKGDECSPRLHGFFAPGRAAVLVKTESGFRALAMSPRFKVNGKYVADAPLSDGDLLECGAARFRFCAT